MGRRGGLRVLPAQVLHRGDAQVVLGLIAQALLGGGEGVKERCDFLAFAAKRGATLEDFAWMENIYSPPIGALFEPIAIAAQNGLAELRKQAKSPAPASASASVPA